MKGKEGFSRMSIDEMRARKEAQKASLEFDQWLHGIDEQIDEVKLQVLREMGYNTSDSQLWKQLEADGVDLDVTHQYDNGAEKLLVSIKVIQVARIVTFDFKGGETNGSDD